MIEIPLGKNMVAIIDDADYPVVSGYQWKYQIRKGARGGYAYCSIGSRESRQVILMHRLITNAPKGIQVDHANGDRLDNRRDNLRLANHSQNQQNTLLSITNTSGYKGVHWDTEKKLFRARITKNQRAIHLGRFASAIDAALAYDAAARELFGEYARLNFPLPNERQV